MVKLFDITGLTNVHPPSDCEGRGCPVHHPSDHHMNDWPALWRGWLLERICEHGIGHPDPDDAEYRASQGDDDTIHGCDGCCVSPQEFNKIQENQ